MTDNLHDTIESALVDIVPSEGLTDETGTTHTACDLARLIEAALRDAGHVTPEEET